MSVAAANVWPKKRLKYGVALRRTRVDGADDERPYVGLEQIESGTGRLVPTASAAESAKDTLTAAGESLSNAFESGDVLFGKLRPYLAKAWIAEFAGRCTTELVVMQPTDFDARFLRYICLSRDFVDAVDASTFGSKMPRADWDFIGNMPVPLPTLRRQREIADYLDRETAQLDALVAEKEHLLELLAEKRRALITRAVTRGVDDVVLWSAPAERSGDGAFAENDTANPAGAPRPTKAASQPPHSKKFRDSGIPWLGKIPEQWEVKRLKHISPFITVGVVVNPSSYVTSEGVPFLFGSDITERGIIITSTTRRMPLEVSRRELAKTCLRANDLVTVRVGYPGVTAVVPPELDGANCASVMLVRGTPSFDSKWLAYTMNSAVGRSQVEEVQYGAAQEQFNIGHAIDFRFPVPPLPEQRAIVAYIEQETAKLDALRDAMERTIKLLKERRAALIAAAVTGKLDVSRAA